MPSGIGLVANSVVNQTTVGYEVGLGTSPMEIPQLDSPRVLIVEDDADIRFMIREVLELEGFEVHEADHSREALDLIVTGEVSPDLILLDLATPVMTGWEFLERRKSDPALTRIPVLVITAVAPNRCAEIELCLHKPFDLHRLINSVRALCHPSLEAIAVLKSFS